MALTLTADDLVGMNGSENLHRDRLSGLHYTDGVRTVAEKGGAYWLLGEIFGQVRFHPKARREPFQVWTLKRNKRGGASLTMTNGHEGCPPLVRRPIPFTDFPLDTITLYFENDILMLPAER